MAHPTMSREEIAAQGSHIYETRIRPTLGPNDDGKYLVIDVDSGEYELGEDEASVSRRAYDRHPGAPLYGIRVGHRAWGRIGLGGAANG